MRRFLFIFLAAVVALATLPVEGARQVTVAELPNFRNHLVSIRGTVRDVFQDESDDSYLFLLLQAADGRVFVAIHYETPSFKSFVTGLIEAEVEITGTCHTTNNENSHPRRHLGSMIIVSSKDRGVIRVIRPAPEDPFLSPEIAEDTNMSPDLIQQQGRRRARGQVRAVWGKGNLLLTLPSGRLSHVELAVPAALPSVGSFVEVVGFLDTDAYRLNLTRAVWRPTAPWPVAEDAPKSVSARRILSNGKRHTLIDTQAHGQLISLSGTVRTMPGDADDGIIRIDSDGYTVPVDASGCPAALDTLTVGCRIRATGICLLDIENFRPNNAFPQARGFSLVLRRPADLTILERPPWWTAKRLAWLLAVASVLLIGLFIWNRSLSILAERRGRQLAEEQIQRTSSDLKILERTRLAVDLHDALSQNLTGVTFALDAARASAPDASPIRRYLEIASLALLSCRTELRNCLWDLRNNALGGRSMDEAIRRSLIPIIGSADVRIRFNVPRQKLSDDTAHAVLRIVRELTVNGLRHGKAAHIRIAGRLDDRMLRFSVRDDGIGFDARAVQGPDKGHFGLQGIRERVRLFNGELTIGRHGQSGTRVSVSLQLPEFDSPIGGSR